jgi:hypothetical protein
MGNMRRQSFAVVAAALIPCAITHAGVVDEASVGDFSDDRLQPTVVTLEPGINIIRGRSGLSPVPDVPDLDYVTVHVPAMHSLNRFIVSSAFVGGAFSFVAIEAGPIVSIPADWSDIDTPLLGWAHFGSSSVGQDLLPVMANSPGSKGFTPPLPAGAFTLWIMELNTSKQYSYEFEICVEPVCLGDVNIDGFIDGADLAQVLALWGTIGSTPADLDGNSLVDGTDLAIVLGAWGSCGGSD